MKKIINKKNNKNEPWFKWLTRELNSYEAFHDFASGKNPEDVAEDFISNNSITISEVFEDFAPWRAKFGIHMEFTPVISCQNVVDYHKNLFKTLG